MKFPLLHKVKIRHRIIIACISVGVILLFVLLTLHVRYSTSHDFSDIVSRDAIFYLQVAKPSKLLEKVFGESEFPSSLFTLIDAVMKWEASFRDIQSRFHIREFAVSVFDDDSRVAVLFVRAKKQDMEDVLAGYDIYEVADDIVAISFKGEDIVKYLKINKKDALTSVVSKDFIGEYPVKAYFRTASFQKFFKPAIFSLSKSNSEYTTLLLKKKKGGWFFQVRAQGMQAPPEAESSLSQKPYILEDPSDDVFIHGIKKEVFLGYAQKLFFHNIRSKEFVKTNLVPIFGATFDIALKKTNNQFIYDFVVAARAQTNNEDVILEGLKSSLSFIFPLKKEKILLDGSVVYEEIADPKTVHIEYKDAKNKVFSFGDPQQDIYYYFDKNVVMLSNSISYLQLHASHVPSSQNADFEENFACDPRNAQRFIVFGKNAFENFFSHYFTDAGIFAFIKPFTIFESLYVAPTINGFAGCVL